MRLNREANTLNAPAAIRNLIGSRSRLLRFICAWVILSVAAMSAVGQENPQRGFQPGNAYSISDIEVINNTNGNVSFNFPLGQLAPGRGGLTGGLTLRYNSKLYNSEIADLVDSSGQLTPQSFLVQSHNAGWDFVNPLSYRVEFISRFNVEGSAECVTGLDAKRMVYIWKVKVIYPDGAEREFRPAGHNDVLGDGYFNVDPRTGEKREVVVTCIGTDPTTGAPICACNTGSIGTAPNPMTYFSTDGTYTRLVITRGTGWTLSFPDGSRVVSNGGGGHNTGANYFYDRNGNYLTTGTVTLPTGELAGGLVDQFGRYVVRKRDTEAREDYIYSLGFNNQSLKWTVKWKTIYILRAYRTGGVSDGRGRGTTSDQTFESPLDVVESITLPAQLGNLSYQFSYNAHDYVDGTPEPTTPSVGWGEVSGITLPSGAQVSYQYSQDSTTKPSVRFVLDNHLRRKTLTYQAEYDGEATPVSETWSYSVGGLHTGSSIVGPDGGVTTFFFKDTTSAAPTAGQVFKVIQPDGVVIERNWQPNKPPTSIAASNFNGDFGLGINFYVKTEFRSIPDAAGNLAWTAITDYNYDKNGNVTRVAEYDWVPYSSYVNAGGIPAGITPSRVSVTTYHNPTPDATDSTNDSAGAYWKLNAPLFRGASASSEMQTGTGQQLTRNEFSYDDPFTTGNLTKHTSWDSSKGAYSSPLLLGNSISTSTVYNDVGLPILTTDARQMQTEFIYETVGSVSNLYPTEIKTALGTPVQRKERREYDFNTGLVTKVTDADNSVSTITSYDAVGRQTLVRIAADLPEERKTSTQYFDLQRRVVVRSDLDETGDGKLANIQHYDQLGRLRLTRQLEEFSIEALEDEEIGIKVQTRYRINNPCHPTNSAQCLSDNSAVIGTYVLISTPYRAATSDDASSESTMGWTRARSDRTGRLVETQTFSGSSLPAPWAASNASTGTVTTLYDAIFTSVTDQAGKTRRSKADALGKTVRVDEPDASNNLGSPESPLQATNYQYDSLGNLTFVTQGSQIRTFKYTSLSRLRESTNPESGTINYEYDENGNLKSKLDSRVLPNSNRVTTSYDYDQLNRLISRSYNDGTPNVTYTYDASGVLNSRGRLTGVSSSVSSYSYGEYDAIGRVKRGTQNTNSKDYLMSYEYNAAGTLISQTYPSGRVVKTEYDGAGRIAGVKNNATGAYYAGAAPTDTSNRFQYSAASAIQAMRFGNGLWEHADFNSRLQPIQIGLGSTSTNSSILQLDYDFGTTNNNGNLQGQTIVVPTVGSVTGFTATQTYTYDSLNRLATAKENNGNSWTQNFDYDRYGNRKLLSGTTLPAALTPANNPVIDPNNNRIDVLATGQTNVSYDNAGNLTREVAGHTYQYDADNKLATYDGGATSGGGATYSYDGNGNRVKKVVGGSSIFTTVFVYDIYGQLVAEYADSGPTTNGTSYVTSDMLGSTRVVTGANQEVKSRYDYLPFGEELSGGVGGRNPQQGYSNSDGLRQRFTSKERDIETGLDYFNARYYASVQGRFTSVDPSGKSILIGNPQTWNRYSYAYNQPFAFVDRNGKWPTKIHNLIIDRALPGLSNWERQQIKDGSWFVDDPINGGQHTANSNNHGMTKPGQSQEDAADRADNYINNHVDMAQDHMARGYIAWSLFFFGNAFHTVSDMTSPAHEGYQVWRKRTTFLHTDTERDISPFRMGLAVGATILLYKYTYGAKALEKAVNFTPGSENDPSVQAIRQQFATPGSDPRAEAEALYEYRLGLQEGLNYDWGTQRGRKGRRQSERLIANPK